MKFSLGCDPELFLWDNILQRIVPAIGLIGGTKESPLAVDGGMMQLDGTVVEFGTNPAYTADEFVNNIQRVIKAITSNLVSRYELRCGALAGYHVDDISPKSEALEVGCSPQYTFSGECKLSVVKGQSKLSPSAIPIGGHIHVGFGVDMSITDERLVATAQRFVDRAILFLNFNHSTASERRTELMGGNVPLVRIKPYGFELRNFDSYWLCDEVYARTLFSFFQSIYFMMQGKTLSQFQTTLDDLGTCHHKVATKLSNLPAKYQQTLPLDY